MSILSLAPVTFALPSLHRAWQDVVAKDMQDGERAAGVARFAENAEERLTNLAVALVGRTYTPRDLTEVIIESGAKQRALHVPGVTDRIVERAILTAVTPYVDPTLGHSAYAYRPGLGVLDAVEAVVGLRDEGLSWVLRTDVDDCFPTIPVGIARRMLGALVPDEELLKVVDLLLDRGFTSSGRGRRSMRGLAQGCALSPLLANLVLTQVDEALLEAGYGVVRYADDLAVVVATREEAWEAARICTHLLEGLGMELGADKTEVMSFDDGFCFLGEDFGPRYPPTINGAGIDPPERRVLYISQQGSRVRTADGRLIVDSDDDTRLLDLPTALVSRIVCFGSVGVSAGVRAWAMLHHVDVVFASRRGSYLGGLTGGSPVRISRVKAQIAAQESEVSTVIARSIVQAKVRKQIVVLQRFGRTEHADLVREAVRQMRQVLLIIDSCTSAAEVMGVEGAAAAAYWPCLGALLPDEMSFQTRSRQPPMDVANAALSFLYTILAGECVVALQAAGLDPAFGLLHSDKDQRPSLALDLMEEFRPLIVDQIVVQLARKGSLTASSGRVDAGRTGVLLTKAARQAVVEAYERRMTQTTRGALPDFSGTLRRHLYRQAQRLAASILDPQKAWTGLSWR